MQCELTADRLFGGGPANTFSSTQKPNYLSSMFSGTRVIASPRAKPSLDKSCSRKLAFLALWPDTRSAVKRDQYLNRVTVRNQLPLPKRLRRYP